MTTSHPLQQAYTDCRVSECSYNGFSLRYGMTDASQWDALRAQLRDTAERTGMLATFGKRAYGEGKTWVDVSFVANTSDGGKSLTPSSIKNFAYALQGDCCIPAPTRIELASKAERQRSPEGGRTV